MALPTLDAPRLWWYTARAYMDTDTKYALMPVSTVGQAPALMIDPSSSPFRVVVDPQMRTAIKKALNELIDHHDDALASYVTHGKLALESYKEYIELFARALRETMESREGVLYLLKSAGLDGVSDADVNMTPEWRWK